MKKVLFTFLFLIAIVIGAAALLWVNKESLAAHFLSKHLGVPVSIQSLEIGKKEASLQGLWIGNPRGYLSSSAFTAKSISVSSSYDEITGDPLIIDEISLSHLFIEVEFSGRGKETNWTQILESKGGVKSDRNYLIRTLVLEDLTVEVIQADGTVKRYPTIARLEFHNISNETGFPIDEIEKAIFHLMMQDVFKKLNLDQIFKAIQNIPGVPRGLPGLFGS